MEDPPAALVQPPGFGPWLKADWRVRSNPAYGSQHFTVVWR
jgi:hypothetical protein